ncbi:MAG TPA: DUF3857 domain-containing protein [Mucilaginibacter sp.]|nr:DUF3857 domain-containing protein [Mucilaginibacter sp.]
MNKIFTLLLLVGITITVNAQTVPSAQLYGKVDQADLEMKSCDFEKDANAMVLFDKGSVYYSNDLYSVVEEVHRRIKIFNDNGKKEADVRIEFSGGTRYEYVTGIQAQTINLVDGKVEITKLDKKLIYTKTIDKVSSEITFTFPNVKAGSIIEYKYTLTTNSNVHIPSWDFQDNIPVRYSEYSTAIPDIFYFRPQPHLTMPLLKHTHTTDGRSLVDGASSYPYSDETEIRAMANIPSLPDEPYMSSFYDNVQSIRFQIVSIRPIGGFAKVGTDTWAKVGGRLADDDDFGGQLKRKLNNEEAIINKAKALKTIDEKIAYVFNEVKTAMKWNGVDHWYTVDGTSRAWENKSGNSAEVNLILYHLLKQSGVNAYPMVVSTRHHGRLSGFYTSTSQFNRAVVYVPLDTTKNYILDATGKYNLYNETPEELLNSSGLFIDKQKNSYDMIFLKKDLPIRQVVLINAEIKPGGKLEGTADISSTSYHKINATERYKRDGEKKYIEYLCDGDNNMKISTIKMENMEIDTLPLRQKLAFNLELAGSDENYIYLNPNIFTSLKNNAFLSEHRATDIDFGYLQNYSINGIYKMPAGYKTDALPKSVTIVMPDKSVSFKRFVGEQDGSIVIRYSIIYNKPEYSKDTYPDFHEFIKKMHEMLNEQIILKKS